MQWGLAQLCLGCQLQQGLQQSRLQAAASLGQQTWTQRSQWRMKRPGMCTAQDQQQLAGAALQKLPPAAAAGQGSLYWLTVQVQHQQRSSWGLTRASGKPATLARCDPAVACPLCKILAASLVL